MTLVSAYKKDFISRNIIDGDITSVHFSSVAQSCLILWDPMDYSTPGLPVHHQLMEFTQTHIHSVSDAMQASHPLSSPSPPTFNLSQHQKTLFFIKKKKTNQIFLQFCDSSVGKESTCNAGDPGSNPGSGISAGEGIGYPLQSSLGLLLWFSW